MIGKIAEIWRYPVKSMRGEKLQSTIAGPGGIVGDRGWAIRDEKVGEIRGAKNIPRLMLCSARYVSEPTRDTIPHVEISFPDGEHFLSSASDAHERLSNFLGRHVTLWPLQPASDNEHYRRRDPLDSKEKIKTFLSREEGDPVPELIGYSEDLVQEVGEFTSPRGTYFDLCPLHLLTTSTLLYLAGVNTSVNFDIRRFRPNFLVDTAHHGPGFIEFEWSNHAIRIGTSEFQCGPPTIRCGMTAHEQIDLPKQPAVLRTIVEEGQHVGIYLEAKGMGQVAVGDSVSLAE